MKTRLELAKEWWEWSSEDDKLRVEFPAMNYVVKMAWNELENDEKWAIAKHVEEWEL